MISEEACANNDLSKQNDSNWDEEFCGFPKSESMRPLDHDPNVKLVRIPTGHVSSLEANGYFDFPPVEMVAIFEASTDPLDLQNGIAGDFNFASVYNLDQNLSSRYPFVMRLARFPSYYEKMFDPMGGGSLRAILKIPSTDFTPNGLIFNIELLEIIGDNFSGMDQRRFKPAGNKAKSKRCRRRNHKHSGKIWEITCMPADWTTDKPIDTPKDDKDKNKTAKFEYIIDNLEISTHHPFKPELCLEEDNLEYKLEYNTEPPQMEVGLPESNNVRLVTVKEHSKSLRHVNVSMERLITEGYDRMSAAALQKAKIETDLQLFHDAFAKLKYELNFPHFHYRCIVVPEPGVFEGKYPTAPGNYQFWAPDRTFPKREHSILLEAYRDAFKNYISMLHVEATKHERVNECLENQLALIQKAVLELLLKKFEKC